MINIGICGANGRMGQEIKHCLKNDKKAQIGFLFDKDDDIQELFDKSDIIIDFSSAQGTTDLLNYAKNYPKPLLIGTTGLNDVILNDIKDLSIFMPIFYATNMSLGIGVLNYLAVKATKILKDFDIEILEMHHRHKKDSPSGTALTLAQKVANAKNLDLNKIKTNGRNGLVGPRSQDEIAIMSLRGGDIIGRHTIGFYEDGEFLELTHNATSRATFAKGAIKIAKWLINQKNSFYTMDDFLGDLDI